jgi:hypothetical protein
MMASKDEKTETISKRCGTAYRGCAPECTFQAWHERKDAEQP